MNNNTLSVLILTAVLSLVSCGSDERAPATTEPAAHEPGAAAPDAGQSTAPAMAESLEEKLSAASRQETDRARDAARKPAEVLRFLGVEPGMDVLDLMAGGGWYTEVLSVAVGPEGTVVAHNTDAALRFRDGANEKAISERLAGNRLPNVTRLNKNVDELTAGDGNFDVVITALNFHDVYNNGGQEAAVVLLEKVGAMLKPGGVVGIIDHAGNPGADNAGLHRIDQASVVAAAEAAGFTVAGESDILRNPEDDRTAAVFDQSIRGNTDRFLLKLQKAPQ